MPPSRESSRRTPKDSGVSTRVKSEPDAPLPPPPPPSKDRFFICDRCEQPRAIYRRLRFKDTSLQVCDYCHQPPGLKEVRDASIVFEMKWCQQGNHEAPAINFRDEGNMSCYHCADRIASYPSKPLPELPTPLPLQVRPRPDPDSRGCKGVAAAPGNKMKQQQQQQHIAPPDQLPHESPQHQYYAGSYRPRGFENSSRPPKTMQVYQPQVRLPNMGKYITKPLTSALPQRLNSNAGAKTRPQPRTNPALGQEPSRSKVILADQRPKNTKAQVHHHHHHNPQHQMPQQQEQKKSQKQQQQQQQRPPPQSPHAKHPPVPSWKPTTQHDRHQKPPQGQKPQKQQQQQQPPQKRWPQKRPRPKTQYDKPPAGPSWEFKALRAQGLKQQQQQQHLLKPQQASSTEGQARSDSDVLGPQATCPACGQHRPTYSELIEAYGYCFHCLRAHLVGLGELLECPSCRQLQMREDFRTYDRDGLVVRDRTDECAFCQWRQRHHRGRRRAARLGTALLCGGWDG